MSIINVVNIFAGLMSLATSAIAYHLGHRHAVLPWVLVAIFNFAELLR